MERLYVETRIAQSPKHAGALCGDVAAVERTASSTTLIVSDGMGSGTSAHLSATLAVAHLTARLREGASFRNAFMSTIRIQHTARGTDLPYAVLAVARIRHDGSTTVLTYEAPPPLLLMRHHAAVPEMKKTYLGVEEVGELNCHLASGEGVLLMTDGITQAGMGETSPRGFGPEGACRYVDNIWRGDYAPGDIAQGLHDCVRGIWGVGGDDCTVATGFCRPGVTATILTGPPENREHDRVVVGRFLSAPGRKVICGATTAKVVSAVSRRPLKDPPEPFSLIAPPGQQMDGIDLVSEGAITLTQVCNVLDAASIHFTEISAVSELYEILTTADHVHLMVGGASNEGNDSVAFLQQGILTRRQIVPLLAGKLRERGKLVTIEAC